jgi:hypothetical protein
MNAVGFWMMLQNNFCIVKVPAAARRLFYFPANTWIASRFVEPQKCGVPSMHNRPHIGHRQCDNCFSIAPSSIFCLTQTLNFWITPKMY